MGHGGARRTVRALALAVAVVAVAAACQPIVFHTDTGEVTSKASMRAVRTSTVIDGERRPGIQIRIRDCFAVDRTPEGTSVPMRATARVVMGEGSSSSVLFDNERLPATGRPGVVIRTTEDSTVIDVPSELDGTTVPITVEAGCTTDDGLGDEPFAAWRFDRCETDATRRACALTSAGRWDGGDWQLGAATTVGAVGDVVIDSDDTGRHLLTRHGADTPDTNGNVPLYLRDVVDGSETVVGTGRGGDVADSGSVVAYTSSTSPDAEHSTVRVWDGSTGSSTAITDDSVAWQVSGITAGGNEVLYGRYQNSSLPFIGFYGPTYAYDRGTGLATEIESDPTYRVADLSADGRFVLFDYRSDRYTKQLVLLDRSTGSRSDIGAQPESFYREAGGVSDDGRYVVYTELTGAESADPTWSTLLLDRTTDHIETLLGPTHVPSASSAISGNGRYLAYNDRGVVVRDLTSGRTNRINGYQGPLSPPQVRSVSNDGRFVQFGTQTLWDRAG